jgi:hypothetical protein
MANEKDRLFGLFSKWVQQNPRGLKVTTLETYIPDARRILYTDDCLPGGGYKAVWHHMVRLDPRAETMFGKSVSSRFRDKKSDCHATGKLTRER